MVAKIKKSQSGNKRICIVTLPIEKSGVLPLSNLVDIIHPLCKELFLITGNAGYEYFQNDTRLKSFGVQFKTGTNLISRVSRYLIMQTVILFKIIGLTTKSNLFLFFIGGPHLTLSILILKLIGKKVILILAGSEIQTAEVTNTHISIVKMSVNISLRLSDNIIVYSNSLIDEYKLEKYKSKIIVGIKHFINFKEFKELNKLSQREDLVGYIGRLSKEKGTLKFINAIPDILARNNTTNFLVGGDGQLKAEIESYLNENNLNERVKLVGWITHANLPKYLNTLKLVVLPSYSEGLPNIMLEAMACGTPVLSTPVGAVPDFIKDTETGFIMENNSSDCIAFNILRALRNPDLETIASSARIMVEKEFTFEKAMERYREILTAI